MWHIYTMEYYCSHKKKGEFMSFAGTWMNLETTILRKLTQEQKTKHHMFSLISQCWTMRTHGHREGSTTHWGLLGGIGEGQWGVWSWGGITWGKMPDIGDGGWRQQTTFPCMYLCNNPAWSAHVPQNLKYNFKNSHTGACGVGGVGWLGKDNIWRNI